MPIEPYKFDTPEVLKQQQQEKYQSFLQSNDPKQQQLANSQIVVDALFGNPQIKKASAVQQVIQESQELERDEGEDQLDYEMRKQKYVMEKAAGIDPNISVQANQNLLALYKDKKAQSSLEQKDARSKAIFDRETTIFEAERTPIIEKYNPLTQEWEPSQVGKFGDEVVGFQEKATQLNQEAQASGSETRYRVNNQASMFDVDSVIAKGKAGTGSLFSKNETRKYREQVQSQTDAISAYVPLVEMLASSPQALQGVSMDNMGNMEPGVANEFFQGLEELGQEAMLALESAGLRTDIFKGPNGEWKDVNEVVAEGLRKQGIESDIAQAKVVGVAYAIAKARDPGGRLSDQDVSLALRSLTGRGGARQIASLFRDQLQQGKGQIDTIYAAIQNEPDIIPSALRNRYQSQVDKATGVLDALDKKADALNQPEVFSDDAAESIDLGDGFSYTITGG